MTTWKKMMMWGACVLLFTACDKKTDDVTPEAPNAEEPAANVEPESPKQDEAPEVEVVTVEDFSTKLAGASCEWVQTCKNEELVQFLQFGVGMMISFGSMGRPDLKAEMEPVLATLKKAEEEKRLRLTAEECTTTMGLAFKLGRLDGASLTSSIDAKRVTFDEKMAAQCIAAFGEEKTLCSEEIKVDAAQKMGFARMQESEKKYKEGMEVLTTACENVFAGQVDDGGECMESYECKGEAKCKSAPGAKSPDEKKTCTAAPKEADAPE